MPAMRALKCCLNFLSAQDLLFLQSFGMLASPLGEPHTYALYQAIQEEKGCAKFSVVLLWRVSGSLSL
jgi:hypothetical protein